MTRDSFSRKAQMSEYSRVRHGHWLTCKQSAKMLLRDGRCCQCEKKVFVLLVQRNDPDENLWSTTQDKQKLLNEVDSMSIIRAIARYSVSNRCWKMSCARFSNPVLCWCVFVSPFFRRLFATLLGLVVAVSTPVVSWNMMPSSLSAQLRHILVAASDTSTMDLFMRMTPP